MQNMILLDDTDDLVCQIMCDANLMATLDELAAIVETLPLTQRRRLTVGVEHLRSHIRSETARLCTEVQGRLN